MVEGRGGGSRLGELVSQIARVWKRLGSRHVLLWLGSVLGRRVSFHIFVVVIHPIDDVSTRVFEDGSDLEARFLSREDVERFASGEQYRYTPAFAADALTRGHRCFGIFERGRLLSYCWYARGPAPVFDDIEVVVDLPLVYGYNAYTDSAHRGRRLHILEVCAAAEALRPEGVKGITAYIEADNVAPLMAAHRMGEAFVGYVFLHRWFGTWRWFATSGCRKAGFSVRRRACDVEAKTSQESVAATVNPKPRQPV